MPRENKTKYAILGILDQKDATGYDIKKYCDETISFIWNENFGHIYPVLKKLEKENLISKRTEQSDSKLKNIFSITDLGRKELSKWLLSPNEHQPKRYEFLLKFVFSKDIPLEYHIKNLEKEKNKANEILNDLKRIEESIVGDERLKSSKIMKLWYHSLRFGIIEVQGRIKWCDETIENLNID